jgi:hypothetical protein
LLKIRFRTKKYMGILYVLLFSVAFIPSMAFSQTGAEAGAANAGAAAGTTTAAGVGTGTIAIGAVIASIVVISVLIATTNPTDTTTSHH